MISTTGPDCRPDYIQIMETQAVAAYLAAEFNKSKPSSAKNIVFVEVSVVQAFERDGTPIYYNVEKLLSDYKLNFTKWSNNAGKLSFCAGLNNVLH